MAERLRDQSIDVLFHCGGGSFKAQMKKADASGAHFAAIIGDDEAAAGEVTLKYLRETSADGETGRQQRVAVDRLGEEIMNALFEGEETDGSL